MFFTQVFHISEVRELFTVFDYKALLVAVEEHFRSQYALAGIDIGLLRVYYNPEQAEGIGLFIDTSEHCIICDMEFAYGTDFVTVQFN